MKQEEIERCRYRRQYLLTPYEITCPFLYQRYPIGNQHHLYAHVDLPVTQLSDNKTTLVLLGDMFDYEFPDYSNADILKDLFDEKYEKVVEKTAKYSGRFVIIFFNESTLSLVHDLTATRKIYYCNFKDKVWCASQPHLLAKTLGIGKTKDPSRLAFYNSPDFVRLFNSNIGNLTIYDNIYQVMPNYYFDLLHARSVRYWPNKPLKRLAIKKAATNCSEIIKGYLKSMANRYEVMIPVTAGKDSRILLSASREFSDKVTYYINKRNDLTEKSLDIALPKKLLDSLNLKLHILEPVMPIDPDFEKVYFENNKMASHEFLPIIYNYYLNFPKKVNLPGNIASAGFEMFKYVPKKVTIDYITYSYKLNKYSFARQYYKKWLDECTALCKSSGINIMSLFYWEERLGNWGTQIQLEKDIAQEDFNPFNSRHLVTQFLSVKPKYISSPIYNLHRRIIKKLSPETLQAPINPGWKNSIKKTFYFLGIFKLLYKLKYHLITKRKIRLSSR